MKETTLSYINNYLKSVIFKMHYLQNEKSIDSLGKYINSVSNKYV